MSKKSKGYYSVKNFVEIANEYVNAKVETFEGLERWLTTWFCIKFNTTPNDNRLLDMTLEELLVLYNMFQIKDNPNYYAQQTGKVQDYEQWLQEQMGEEYVSQEDMIKLEQKEKESIKKKFPDKITTNFDKFKRD